MDTVLGQGVNTAAIYTRDGRSELLPLEGITGLEWGRVENAYSEAAVTVLAGRARGCYRDLGKVHTWAHSLVIFRDTGAGAPERVWEGPITTKVSTASQVTLTARDVSAWTTRRRIRNKRVGGVVLYWVTGEAQLTLDRAFATDDPNVLAHVQVFLPPNRDDEPTLTRDVKVNSGYAYDDLGNLVGEGLRWTVLGRSFLLHPDNVTLGTTATLIPEEHTTAEVALTESGDDLATRVTAANEKVSGTAVATGLTAGGVSPFYGLHDMLTEHLDRTHEASLTRVATRAVRRAYPAPQLLTIPDGSALDPAAPLPMSHLVPGRLIPVASEAFPDPVNAVFSLTGVKVKQEPAGETVTIDLIPVTG